MGEPSSPGSILPPFIVLDRSEALDILGSLLDVASMARERNEPVVAFAAEGVARVIEIKLFANDEPRQV